MIKLFAKSEEKFAKSVVLYADSDNYLCSDEDATEKVSKDVVENLFKKGMLKVVTEDAVYAPTTFVDATTYVTVSLLAMGTTAAEAVTFYSSEYTAS